MKLNKNLLAIVIGTSISTSPLTIYSTMATAIVTSIVPLTTHAASSSSRSSSSSDLLLQHPAAVVALAADLLLQHINLLIVQVLLMCLISSNQLKS
jgi:hypothetical protein